MRNRSQVDFLILVMKDDHHSIIMIDDDQRMSLGVACYKFSLVECHPFSLRFKKYFCQMSRIAVNRAYFFAMGFLPKTALWLFFSILVLTAPAKGQADTLPAGGAQPGSTTSPLSLQQKKSRQLIIGGINLVGYGGSLAVLSQAWYDAYDRTGFHTFNDSGEWLQMDKIGHGWAAYNAGKVSSAMWRWAGVQPKKAALIGGLSSTAFLTAVEFMDAHSAKWGWSWADIAANIGGSGLFIGQELLWGEQRIQYKFSFHGKKYGEAMLENRADELFGASWYERMLKDYNAQTYWLSLNLHSFLPQSQLPGWLNVAFGYGADGMYGGFRNEWDDEGTGLPIHRGDIPRKRQFYLAPDVDFTKIKTNSKWLRTIFTFLNAFKFPAPTLMLDNHGSIRFYPLYF